MDAAQRTAGWRTVLSDASSKAEVIVAETEGQIIGFTAVGPGGHEAFGGRGEIKQLYVDQAQQGEGLGARLMQAAAQRLADRGFTTFGLAVVEGNTRAKAFYERLGGRDTGRFTDPGPLWKSRNRLMVWDGVESFRW